MISKKDEIYKRMLQYNMDLFEKQNITHTVKHTEEDETFDTNNIPEWKVREVIDEMTEAIVKDLRKSGDYFTTETAVRDYLRNVAVNYEKQKRQNFGG